MIDQKKILVVDDDLDLTMLCKMILEDEGFKVDAFTDPLLALFHFKPNLYDLLIFDIKMPELDGFELYKKVKEFDKNSSYVF